MPRQTSVGSSDDGDRRPALAALHSSLSGRLHDEGGLAGKDLFVNDGGKIVRPANKKSDRVQFDLVEGLARGRLETNTNGRLGVEPAESGAVFSTGSRRIGFSAVFAGLSFSIT